MISNRYIRIRTSSPPVCAYDQGGGLPEEIRLSKVSCTRVLAATEANKQDDWTRQFNFIIFSFFVCPKLT
jgi:hypothetical protein